MGVGRPTTCDQATIDMALSYLDTYEELGHAIPSVVGLCKVIKRARSSVYEWAEKDGHVFADILARINEEQEFIAWNKGLKNEYNSNLVKLLLGKHGYHDKTDQTIAAPGGGAINVTFIPVNNKTNAGS